MAATAAVRRQLVKYYKVLKVLYVACLSVQCLIYYLRRVIVVSGPFLLSRNLLIARVHAFLYSCSVIYFVCSTPGIFCQCGHAIDGSKHSATYTVSYVTIRATYKSYWYLLLPASSMHLGISVQFNRYPTPGLV